MILLQALKEYKSILVTGAQRSGTTIAAHILAEELGKRYVDEDEIDIYNWYAAMLEMEKEPSVLQAPGLMHCVNLFTKPSWAVVVMRRDLNEIYSSEERIGWRTINNGFNLMAEMRRYKADYDVEPVDGNIAALKYQIWETKQKPLLKNAYELPYEELKGHPLFKSDRNNFEARQWK